jgi:hypothetical protein
MVSKNRRKWTVIKKAISMPTPEKVGNFAFLNPRTM